MTPARASLSFELPKALTLEPYLALDRHQVQKIAAVGLASLAFFGVQFYLPWVIAGQIAFTLSGITLLSEALLERKSTNWFNPNINFQNLIQALKPSLITLPLIVGLMTLVGISPLQAISFQLMHPDLKTIALATLVAPLAEEILFRGFLQERLEDLFDWVDRKVIHLSEKTKILCSAVPQAVLFGALHILNDQVTGTAKKVGVFLQTLVLGLHFTQFKLCDESLVSPLIVHSAQNTGMLLGLAGGAFAQRTLALL